MYMRNCAVRKPHGQGNNVAVLNSPSLVHRSLKSPTCPSQRSSPATTDQPPCHQRVRSTSSNDGEFSRLSHVMASADHRSLGSPAAHVVTAVSSSAPPSWPQ